MVLIAFIDRLESSVEVVAPLLRLVLDITSLLCVTIGLFTTIKLALHLRRCRRRLSFERLRLTFGQWLALALEFQLGADIVNTTFTPSFETLGKLAIIAVIRTFLNYFLSKELKEEAQIEAS
jgi:uncharacterized membrane protein